MSLRTFVVTRALGDDDAIIQIHGHGFATFLPYIGVRCGGIVLLFFVAQTITPYISTPLMISLLTITGLVVYGFALIRFLDIYLDVIVIAKNGLHVFKREGVFQSNVQTIERESVQSIQDSQNGLIDNITHSGDLKIFFQYGEIIFYDIHHPATVRININLCKDKILAKKQEEATDSKFDMLVDALSDVIATHYDDTDDAVPSPRRTPGGSDDGSSSPDADERVIHPFRPYG